MRIRIQQIRLRNAVPEADPLPGFVSMVLMTDHCKILQLEKTLFYLSKFTRLLSLGLQEGRPSYKPPALTIQHFKHEISSLFLFLWVIFALLVRISNADPDPQH
jgi:hypothetical protein